MTIPTAFEALPLVGSVVRLDPATVDDAAGIFEALDDARVYAKAYNGGARPASPADVADWIDAAARSGRAMYTVRLVADGALGRAGDVVGTTSLGDIDRVNLGAHVGWTAYSPTVWGSAVNAECKLLLLGYAFETCGFERVKIQTDHINERSQAAIAKLGAVREGVLRHHRLRADGTWRDTVVFSILADEWPAVRAGLGLRVNTWLAANL